MIVLDASVVVELVLNQPLGLKIERAIVESNDSILVPHLLDLEVLSALRKWTLLKLLDSHRSQQAIRQLAELPAERCSHLPLRHRIWELRSNFTVYDATYVALAEASDGVLYTCDAKLRQGHRARVVYFDPA